MYSRMSWEATSGLVPIGAQHGRGRLIRPNRASSANMIRKPRPLSLLKTPQGKDKAFVDQAGAKFKENITKAIGNLRLMLEGQQPSTALIDEPPLMLSSERFLNEPVR